MREITFEKCTDCMCEEEIPHGHFFKEEMLLLPIRVASVAAGRYAMDALSHTFKGVADKLEIDIWMSGLPDQLEHEVDIDIADEDLEDILDGPEMIMAAADIFLGEDEEDEDKLEVEM